MSGDLDRIAAHAADTDIDPADIQDDLTADLDDAIFSLEHDILHGHADTEARRELVHLQAERARLVAAWNAAFTRASYRLDKLNELADAPDAAAAADAVARWNLLDGAPRLPVDPPAADPPASLPSATKAELHAAVLHHVAGFFAKADAEGGKPRVLLTAETGGRKTGILLAYLRQMIDSRKAAGLPYRVILAIPAHRLGREVLKRAESEGLNAAVFQGRGDIAKPDQPCRNLDMVQLARQAGADIRKTVCGPGPDGARCTWRNTCDYFAGLERAAATDVVIVAHNFLTDPLPTELKHGLGWIVIDEDFASLVDSVSDLGLGALSPEMLARSPVLDADGLPDAEATAELGELFAMAEQAARGRIGGYLPADPLREARFTLVSDAPGRMRKLNWRRAVKVEMQPGMDPDDRKEAARAAATNGQLPRIAALTHALEGILSRGDAGAGLVSVRMDTRPRGSEIVLTVRGQREPAAWMADLPVLMMSATGRLGDIQRFFPTAELAEAPRAAWPHCEVHQITGGFGRSTLTRHKTRLAELRDFITLATLDKPSALVVTHKSTEDTFMGTPGLATAHHGAIAGLSVHQMVDIAFIIGGTFASKEDIASLAAARGGGAVTIAKPEKTMRAALLTSGAAVGIECLAYADPAADAVHRGIYDASIIQAIGRVRPVERTAANPATVFQFGNAAELPFPGASVTRWQDCKPDRIARMVAGGAVWTNAEDMAAFCPNLFKSARAAEAARSRAVGTVANMREAVRQIVRHDPRGWIEITYQPPGQGKRQRPVFCPSGSEAAVYAAIEGEYGTPVRWRVTRLTVGREVTPTPGKLDTYPAMGVTSPAPAASPAFYAAGQPEHRPERPPDG